MNSFFDLDRIATIERPCGHYTLNLICCTRLLKFLMIATKSSEGVKIILAVRAIDQGYTNQKLDINETCFDIMNVRSNDPGLPICRMSA